MTGLPSCRDVVAKKTSQHSQQTFFDAYDGSLVLRSKKSREDGFYLESSKQTLPLPSPPQTPANSPSKSITSDLFQHTTVLGSFGSSGLNSCLYSSHFHVQILQPLIIAATSRSVANHTDLRPSAPQTPSSQHNHYIAKRERHGDTHGTGRRRWILFLENISPSVIGDHDQTTIIG
ncbi:hypothetical protein HCBG_07744 [Histoplasma capsulatum G186AR]|uniref:Uncharacterized protein n=1 Tax=Ajellomyces capsulatus (strain G186AR / H82 / ATCC MYA-2454 / RMSCC 2432) TaxID=447093 RepID=C0NXV0_AJECG|nr:uncharacterized protein HCBG_07744 [Histoplasma capsulatum G186AR]EEH03618.1 hypothetical protein HCBG_07744 [Histoplasma capsulatum G186AR]